MGCLRSGWLTTGDRVRQFEQAFADAVGCRHAVAVNSCTAALHLALEALGIRPGDEVVTSPMTFTATAAVIEHLGARPVFADCDPATLNVDPREVARRVGPRTRAILPVHVGGLACDMDALQDIAHRHRLAIVEDAAHAFPARWRGRPIGAISDVTCFSFYATKNLTTGEGGMIATDDDGMAARMRLMSLHGLSRDAWNRYTEGGTWSYEVLAPGFKYNLTDIAASIGLPQLKRFRAAHARRMAIAARYTEAFAGLPGLATPRVLEPEAHAWHLYVVQIDRDAFGIDRDAFIRGLAARNIGSSVHFIPLHLHPYYRYRYGLRPRDYPNALAAYQRIVSLPIHAGLSDADVDDVIEAVMVLSREAGR